ncbi:uncharacterized protein PG986_004609 [Apiospora aurea]|uniref:FluG domain-containing protein n=1 Tax=Apiospora aurea TaxID=335848 RepID=A0ABR1QNU9_9PEZI
MAPTRSRPVLQGPHQGFVNEFIHREQQNRVSKGPKSLTATQHAALRKQLQEVRFLKPAWADKTKINVARILRKWKIFCRDVVNGPWKAVLEQADRATAMDFLLHMCKTYRIKSLGTSWEYYRQYKQLYASVNGRHINTNDNKEILKWHDATLVPHFKLRPPNVDGKPVVNSDGVFALLVFNIAYDDGIFARVRPGELVDNETHKPSDGSWEDLFASKCSTSSNEDNNHAPDEFQLLENILARETTDRGRPKALCYEDIRLMVVRHPETGQDMFSMAVKFIHHKGMDNNPKPTIFWFTMTRKLIFNFINVIICLALCDDAFDAPSLTTVRRVFQVKNAGPVKCTTLRWKKQWLKRPVFRVGDEVVRYHKLRDDLKRQSLDMGNEEPITPKAFRRGNANVMNRKAPDAVRDQALRHDPKWATFNSAYINENIEFNTQNAFLDEPTEDALINLFTHVGMTRDPRARRKMVPNNDERFSKMAGIDTKDKKMRRKSESCQGASKRNKRNAPTWDIERQAAGEEELVELEEAWQPEIDLQIPERAELAEAFLFQPEVPTFEDMLESCIHAVDVMFRLCQKRETPRRTRIHKRAQVQPNITDATPPDPHIFPLLMLKTQCPRCIGDGRLSYQERTFTYSRPAVMNDHFERAHVKEIRDLEQDRLIFCEHPTCVEEGVKLDDLDHFRNHVQTVHGVWLRPRPSVG